MRWNVNSLRGGGDTSSTLTRIQTSGYSKASRALLVHGVYGKQEDAADVQDDGYRMVAATLKPVIGLLGGHALEH